jgi:hypothetical protein
MKTKKDHLMYRRWSKLSCRGVLCEEWANDFWKFAEDVGIPPDNETRPKICRYELDKPFSKDNFYWTSPPDMPRYLSEYRKRNSRRLRSIHLQKKFGITIEDYEALFEEQNGVCAICGEPETVFRYGKLARMSIDHCHAHGHIRGLLCSKCNPALGGFKDSVDILKKAIQYLENDRNPLA